MASNSKHTEWILETIDHLRRRKARPDLQRICHVVKRRHGLGAADTENKLEKLVDAEIVIKVDYKGSTSYRNAAKWRKSMLGCAVLNSTTISTKILEAILELSRMLVREKHEKEIQEGKQGDAADVEDRARKHATEVGVSLESIHSWLKDNCEGFDQLRSPLTVVLKREIDAGRLKRLMSCNYVITAAQMEELRDAIRPLKVNKKSEGRSVDSASVTEESNSGSSDSRPTLPADQRSTPTAAAPTSSSAPQPARRGRPPKNRSTVSPPQTTGSATAVTSAVNTVAPGVSTQSKVRFVLTSSHLLSPSFPNYVSHLHCLGLTVSSPSFINNTHLTISSSIL